MSDDQSNKRERLNKAKHFMMGMRTRPDGTIETALFIKPEESNPIYHSVGRVAVEWAYFEHTLDQIIWHMVGTASGRVGCITGQMMGHAPRFNAIIALLVHRGARKELVDRARSLLNASYDAANRRNRIVHDVWLEHIDASDKLAQWRAMPPKDLRFGISPVGGMEEVEATIQLIRRRFDDAEELWRAVREEIESEEYEANAAILEKAMAEDGDKPSSATPALPDKPPPPLRSFRSLWARLWRNGKA